LLTTTPFRSSSSLVSGNQKEILKSKKIHIGMCRTENLLGGVLEYFQKI
jgi:hypothetical protein